MSHPYLEAHTIDDGSSGWDRGRYSHVPCALRTIGETHNAVEVHHSLFEGDRMTFFQILESRKDALDRKRPIRFYNNDPDDSGVKLFDGVITDTGYLYLGDDYMALRTSAAGWWSEIAKMDLRHPVEFAAADNWTVNEIYEDLVRIANDMGMMKEAVYTYDTAKIPEYGTYNSYYTAVTGTTFVFNNVYAGMQTLTRFLDATAPCTYEFGLRVEALPRLDGIDQDDTKTKIYILPFVINQDKTVSATFKRFKIKAGTNGYDVERDYRRLANDCCAFGDGYDTHQIRTTQPLTEKTISSADQSWAKDNDTLTDHYLKVTMENPSASAMNGYVQVVKTGPVTNTFPMHVPANTTQVHFTSERVQLVAGNCFRAVGFWNNPTGGKITVEEVSTGTSAGGSGTWHTTIAGQSVNQYGAAPHTINGLWLNSQARVDLAAGKHCRLYHAPTHALYAPIISRYVSYNNLIGNTAAFYSPYEETAADFLVTDAVYGFHGKLVTQHLLGMRYEYDWDYDDS